MTGRRQVDPRAMLLAGMPLLTFAALFLLEPIAQDPAYHGFADVRDWLGIPNFANVASNLPFLLIGIAGLVVTARLENTVMKPAWLALFAGVTLVSAGSSWYHLSPADSSLVWDRLPMTLGFMGLFAALTGEFLSAKLGRRMLVPALLLGLASVLLWQRTGDLRLYAWVQFMPLLFILGLLLMYRATRTRNDLLWLALGLYLLAKVLEYYDRPVFEALNGWVSGHSLKHLAAAGGAWALVRYLQRRRSAPLTAR